MDSSLASSDSQLYDMDSSLALHPQPNSSLTHSIPLTSTNIQGTRRRYKRKRSGWKQTIRAILLLSEDFHAIGLKFIQTRNLCQDPLENFFGLIRAKTTNPSPMEFYNIFRRLSASSICVMSANGNCQPDTGVQLLDLTTLLPNISVPVPPLNARLIRSSCIITPTAPEEHLFQNAVHYFAGFLLMKLSKTHNIEDCSVCREHADNECVDLSSIYCHLKTFQYESGAEGKLHCVSRPFLDGISIWEDCFQTHFPLLRNGSRLKGKLLDCIDCVNTIRCCKDEHIRVSMNSFCISRIRREIKIANDNLSNLKSSKRKINILLNK